MTAKVAANLYCSIVFQSYSLLKNTIEECWDVEPEARLTALCVVKRMQQIYDARYDGITTKGKTGMPNDNSDFVEFSSTSAINTGAGLKHEDISLVNLCNNKNEMMDGIFPLNGNRHVYYENGDRKKEILFADFKGFTHAENCTDV